MPAVNMSKNQPRKAKGLGGVFPLRSKNAALLYMYKRMPAVKGPHFNVVIHFSQNLFTFVQFKKYFYL